MKVTPEAVDKIVKRWRPRLGIDARWAMDITLCDTKSGDAWLFEADASACCKPSPGYFQVEMHLNKRVIEAGNDTLEHVILHELVHVVLWPMWTVVRDAYGEDLADSARDLNEAATEQLTRALLRRR